MASSLLGRRDMGTRTLGVAAATPHTTSYRYPHMPCTQVGSPTPCSPTRITLPPYASPGPLRSYPLKTFCLPLPCITTRPQFVKLACETGVLEASVEETREAFRKVGPGPGRQWRSRGGLWGLQRPLAYSHNGLRFRHQPAPRPFSPPYAASTSASASASASAAVTFVTSDDALSLLLRPLLLLLPPPPMTPLHRCCWVRCRCRCPTRPSSAVRRPPTTPCPSSTSSSSRRLCCGWRHCATSGARPRTWVRASEGRMG